MQEDRFPKAGDFGKWRLTDTTPATRAQIAWVLGRYAGRGESSSGQKSPEPFEPILRPEALWNRYGLTTASATTDRANVVLQEEKKAAGRTRSKVKLREGVLDDVELDEAM